MSKLAISKRGYEWSVMELHPEKGLVWLISVPCRRGKKVSVFGKVAPIRETRGRHNLCIFFVQFNKEPGSRRVFFEDFKKKVEQGWERKSLRFHYDGLPAEGSIKVSDIVRIDVRTIRAPEPTSFSGKIF